MSRFENFDGVDIGLFFHARVSDSKPLAAGRPAFPSFASFWYIGRIYDFAFHCKA